jgi:hypothetical protein
MRKQTGHNVAPKLKDYGNLHLQDTYLSLYLTTLMEVNVAEKGKKIWTYENSLQYIIVLSRFVHLSFRKPRNKI